MKAKAEQRQAAHHQGLWRRHARANKQEKNEEYASDGDGDANERDPVALQPTFHCSHTHDGLHGAATNRGKLRPR